jgi:carnitine 3-dehydrogenase
MKAAIVGGGVIGGGWASRFLLHGWDVNVFDPDAVAESRVIAVLENARRTLPAVLDSRLPAEGRLQFCQSIEEAVSGADWVQESVPEQLVLKQRVLTEIQSHTPDDAVVASSTSGFTATMLQQQVPRAAQILVCHPFNPVYLLPLVEVVASNETDPRICDRCMAILRDLGMKPLRVRKEIDAHIADRLLEAVWREALWLVHDEIATTEEIDDAIRYGFGLRWAQMGLFETYRIAGGADGMRHFINQFGPALQWPWSKLVDVPELDAELVERIVTQSDQQSGDKSIEQLEWERDANLVAILRALKSTSSAAGALLNEHDLRLTK